MYLLITLAESVKVGSPQKLSQYGKQIFYGVCLTMAYVDLLLWIYLERLFSSAFFFDALPFDCVFGWNKNSNTVKLSTYTPTWHQNIDFLTEDMSLTKYWCTSRNFSDYFISTMAIYNPQYTLLVTCTNIF